jgi:hypothetical protein
MARVMRGDTAKWKHRGDSGLVQIRADGEPAVCGFRVRSDCVFGQLGELATTGSGIAVVARCPAGAS